VSSQAYERRGDLNRDIDFTNAAELPLLSYNCLLTHCNAL
jgi:hypothetical protein